MGHFLVFFLSHPYARALFAVFGTAPALDLYRIPTRDRVR